MTTPHRQARARRSLIFALATLGAASPSAARGQTEAPEVPDDPPSSVRTSPAPAPSPDWERVVPLAPTAPPTTTPEAVVAPSPASPLEAAPPTPAPLVTDGRPGSPPADEPSLAIHAQAPVAHDDAGLFVRPGALVDFDSHLFQTNDRAPSGTLVLRRARFQATGWVGSWAYFSAAAEYVSPPSGAVGTGLAAAIATTDIFVAIAPLKDLVVLQVGQFDAPFSLENRTSDRSLDFVERSIAVRDLGVPENKAVGATLTGFNEARSFHYALGVFNGDGPTLRSEDAQFDVMSRAWIAPFSFSDGGPLHDLSIGGSLWTGDRENALPLAAQTTQGGLPFLSFDPYTATVGATSTPLQLRQVGLLRAAAIELNVPVAHRYGARAEMLWRDSPLSEENVADPARPIILGGADLHGWATYGQVWFWALGDDRILGDRQGLEPLPRGGAARPEDGLMFALRVSHVDEEVWQENDAALLNLRDPAVGLTTVTSYELGVNYWHEGRFRATCNYGLNHFRGTTPQVEAFKSQYEQEFLFRLGIAL